MTSNLSFNFIDIFLVILDYVVPVVIIIAFVIFFKRRLNSTDKRLDKLEKQSKSKNNSNE